MNEITNKPPSQQAIIQFLENHPQGVEKIIATFLGRSLMIGLAFTVFGQTKSPIKDSLLASATIELYLLYYYSQKQKEKKWQNLYKADNQVMDGQK